MYKKYISSVHFYIQAKKCIVDFIALSRVVEGYQRNNITPYMHLMAAHIPEMITLHGNMKFFPVKVSVYSEN